MQWQVRPSGPACWQCSLQCSGRAAALSQRQPDAGQRPNKVPHVGGGSQPAHVVVSQLDVQQPEQRPTDCSAVCSKCSPCKNATVKLLASLVVQVVACRAHEIQLFGSCCIFRRGPATPGGHYSLSAVDSSTIFGKALLCKAVPVLRRHNKSCSNHHGSHRSYRHVSAQSGTSLGLLTRSTKTCCVRADLARHGST